MTDKVQWKKGVNGFWSMVVPLQSQHGGKCGFQFLVSSNGPETILCNRRYGCYLIFYLHTQEECGVPVEWFICLCHTYMGRGTIRVFWSENVGITVWTAGNGVFTILMFLELLDRPKMVLSLVLFGGYEDDEDHGEWFLYTGRDLWLVTCLSLFMCILLLLVNFIQSIYFHAQSWLPARSVVMDCRAARKDVDSSGEIVLLPLCLITASGTSR